MEKAIIRNIMSDLNKYADFKKNYRLHIAAKNNKIILEDKSCYCYFNNNFIVASNGINCSIAEIHSVLH